MLAMERLKSEMLKLRKDKAADTAASQR